MRRCLIVTGGEVMVEELEQIRADDHIIGVDRGAQLLLQQGKPIHLAVGDFDTAEAKVFTVLKEKKVPLEILSKEKDWTDTHYAVEVALREQPEEIIILGALGGARMDHALANVFLLERIAQGGVRGILSHRHNRMRLHQGGTVILTKSSDYKYLSLLALSGSVSGLSISGAMYPLRNATLYRNNPIGISNEWRKDEITLSSQEGTLLIIESRDS